MNGLIREDHGGRLSCLERMRKRFSRLHLVCAQKNMQCQFILLCASSFPCNLCKWVIKGKHCRPAHNLQGRDSTFLSNVLHVHLRSDSRPEMVTECSDTIKFILFPLRIDNKYCGTTSQGDAVETLSFTE